MTGPDPTIELVGRAADRAEAGMVTTIVALARGWPILVLAALAAALAGIAVVRWVPPLYTARVTVGPVARSGAAAMGVRVPIAPPGGSGAGPIEFDGGEAVSDFDRFLALLTALPVAEVIAADPALLGHLFPDRWDAATRQWRPPTGLAARLRRGFLALVGRADWRSPTPPTIATRLDRTVRVEGVGIGPMRRIRVRHRDRAVALALLDTVVTAADAHLRAEAQRRSAAQIAYIHRQLDQPLPAAHEQGLVDLLTEQQRLALMIDLDLPFAADRLEPVHAAALPDWPDPLAVVAVAAALGLALGAVVVYLRAAGGGALRVGPPQT